MIDLQIGVTWSKNIAEENTGCNLRAEFWALKFIFENSFINI